VADARIWVLFGLCACGAPNKEETSSDAADTDLPGLPPDGPGPFSVGTFDGQVVGSTGVTLDVQVWYPTQDTDKGVHRYDGLYPSLALHAPAPDCTVVRPLLAFSHGNQGLRWQSLFFTERLASHGFVVVAPDHAGNTTLDYDEARLPELIFRRPFDISDTVDWLFSDPLPSEMGLDDCLDPDAGFAVSGHSFGGYTTVAVGGAAFEPTIGLDYCEETGGWLCEAVLTWVEGNPDFLDYDMTDDRVWAMIPMAPAGFEVLSAGLSQVEVPALVLGGDRDTLTSMEAQVTPFYRGIASPDKRLGTLIDGGHMTFSNACDLVDFEECHPPFIDAETAYDTINTVSLAFLRHVLGEPGMEPYFVDAADLWDWTTPDE